MLSQLFQHKTLSQSQAKEVMLDIAKGTFNETVVTSLLTVYLMRSITVEELQGFREGLLELAVPAALEDQELMDIVGTGGDGKNTFNISTLAGFVVAGTGQKVAKHGNYGATSISGASNVMEELGYRFTNKSTELQKQLDRAGCCFLHAPLFHPALGAVAKVRKNIGFRTFFNMLGPLVNPARPAFTLIGVYNMEIARVYNYLLQQLDQPFTIIHGLDGYDEISLTGDTKVITPSGERIYSAVELGKRTVLPQDIEGGATVKDAAQIFLKVLKCEASWSQTAVVLANAAMALQCTGRFADHQSAYEAAVESLESGRAWNCFEKLISLQ